MSTLLRLPQIPALSWDDCRLLVESVQDYAIFMLDAEGFVATWNRGAEQIKGYKASEIVGTHFSVFFPPEDIQAGKPDAELLEARTDGRTEDEGWRLRKDGSLFWANVIITALRDGEGRLRGYAKVTRDLTERRAAEKTLRESEERLRLLVGAVNDYAIYMLDATGHVTTWNPGAERLKGYTAPEILGQHFSCFFPAEARAAGKPELELESARSFGRFEEEALRVRKDGSEFWANVVITPVRGENGEIRGFAKVTRDLSERRAAEEAARRLIAEQAARASAESNEARFRQIAREAEAANRIKDEFLATVSHELRTPLNAILGWAALLRERTRGSAAARGIEVIHRNAQSQAKIIDDILDVSRIVTGKLQLDMRATDLCLLVQDALDVLKPAAAAKHQRLELERFADLGELVGDPVRLQQVAWNLLSNAVKFTRAGGSIRARVYREGSSLVLSVTDDGRGIEPEFLPRLFDRFTQADSSTTRSFGGLGLGLSIVRHIVDLHGGHVSASSEGPGRGATFTVSLPIRAALPVDPPTRGTRDSDLPPRSAGQLTGVRVLVVDDEEDARELLCEILERAGCTVATAGSAREALERIQHMRPHVLVSDIGMPEEDGYSLMRKVRELDRARGGAIPAIALTAYTSPADRTAAFQAGFSTHLAKPVRTADLLAALHTLTLSVER